MSEPDVTLTDYAIVLECAIFCVLIARWPNAYRSLRDWWIAFFGSIAISAFFGGTVHGFFPEPGAAHDALWKVTMLGLGLTALACWKLGSRLGLSHGARGWVDRFAVAQFVVYAIVIVFVTDAFVTAIVAYLPATLFLLVMLGLLARNPAIPGLRAGIVGLVLTFVAAAVQVLRIGLHPVYFNHNALYHVIQAVALYLIFRAARGTTTTSPAELTA